jgi:hypothetical protein
MKYDEHDRQAARLHRGGAANVARRAARIERVALDKSHIHLHAGRPDKALALLVIASRALDRMRGTT